MYCFDSNYAIPTVVSAHSVLRWSPHAQLHLIHQDVSSCVLHWMKQMLPEKTAFYNAGASCWATAKYKTHLAHVSEATNLRLCIPDVLPASVKRVLYLDSDTLVFADLSKFVQDFPASPSGFAARKGGCMKSKSWGHGVFPRAAQPLVAGVLIMDLDTLRNLMFSNVCNKILEHLEGANDQTVINVWCRGVFGSLPIELNMRAEEISEDSQVGVLHYEGAHGKPWQKDYKGPLKDLWLDQASFLNSKCIINQKILQQPMLHLMSGPSNVDRQSVVHGNER